MHSAKFEIDIIDALSSQLEAGFDKLTPGPLAPATLDTLDRSQGIYHLYQKDVLVYIGKADDLPKRLREHHLKLSGRRGINVEEMGFKCLYVHENWTTLAPETSMIRHYKKKGAGECEWNGNGFGPHDPGRNRELTNKAPDGFDMRYPIKEDWPCTWVAPGPWDVLGLLVALKNPEKLPYLIRYETEHLGGGDKFADYRKGHPDHRGVTVTVPSPNMPASELVGLITQALPGWQSTAFPSHLILYKESHSGQNGEGRLYKHGTLIHREP